MELQAFTVDGILIALGMFWWNYNLSKRIRHITEVNNSYHHIFNSSSRYLFIIKPNGNILEINDNALQYYELIKEDILGKPLWNAFSQIITASNQNQLQSAIALVAKGKSSRFDIELLQQKDTLCTCELLLTPIKNKKGQVTRIVADICNLNQATQIEFSLQKQLLQTCFDDASIGLAIINDKWQHVIINKTLADINGKTPEEQIGKAVRDTLPKLATKLEAIYQQVITTGEPIRGIEITGETPKEPGIIRNWEASYFPLSISDDRNAIGCIVLEVTKRKKAQKALTTRLEQQAVVAQLGQLALSGIELTALFDQATVLVAQSLNVDSCKIIELLPESNTLLLRSNVGLQEDLADEVTLTQDLKSQAGYTLLSGQSVILGNLNEETRFTGSELLHQNQYLSGVSTIIPGKENQPFGVLEAHSIVEHQFSEDDANFLQSVANVLSNAIIRKQAEKENRKLNATLEARVKQRTRQLEAANQELEAFCYSVTHDLRAPLRAIQGFSQILLEDYESLFDDIGQEYLHRLIAAAAYLDTLILDLLAYSRLGRTQIKLSQVNLTNLVEEIINELEPQLQEKQAQVIVKSTLPVVIGQPSILKSVITNLIVNAIKFVDSNTNPVIQIWAEEQGKFVKLWIEDNGIGIAPEHQKRIFRIFERLHGVESYPGTGIGLAIVKRGVESLGGKVGVDSTLNQGSRFWIELPKF